MPGPLILAAPLLKGAVAKIAARKLATGALRKGATSVMRKGSSGKISGLLKSKSKFKGLLKSKKPRGVRGNAKNWMDNVKKNKEGLKDNAKNTLKKAEELQGEAEELQGNVEKVKTKVSETLGIKGPDKEEEESSDSQPVEDSNPQGKSPERTFSDIFGKKSSRSAQMGTDAAKRVINEEMLKYAAELNAMTAETLARKEEHQKQGGGTRKYRKRTKKRTRKITRKKTRKKTRKITRKKTRKVSIKNKRRLTRKRTRRLTRKRTRRNRRN